jgi:hypothetical protein
VHAARKRPAAKGSTIDVSKLPPPANRQIDFARDIQPLFQSHCWKCHGAAKHESGLSLHTHDAAFAGGDSGKEFEPGKSAESRLIHYVSGLDSDTLMPPDGEGERLSAEQVGLLRAWIDQGAKWPKQADAVAATAAIPWSYKRPVRPTLPVINGSGKFAHWPRNEIDRFVLARLGREKLSPSPEEDRPRLIRRVSLDLIGLPPTPEEVDAFVADTRPDAYERVVDRLLESPHYGERWARPWLDLARYADTDGYEKDPRRSMWPYRDWVIDALNQNMPFDRFTIEQLAGDLLPGATLEDRIATGFHRNTMTNTEGGVDPEEYRVYAIIDRVNTTATVWLGTTLGCCQCHSHKYDPLKQKEYYEFMAFFNNTADSGSSPAPELEVPSPAEKTDRAELARLEQAISTPTTELASGQAEFERATLSPLPVWLASTVAAARDLEGVHQKDGRAAFYRSIAPELNPARNRIAALRKKIAAERVTTLVMQELPAPRKTHVFVGGSFLNPGEEVEPGVPAAIGSISARGLAHFSMPGEKNVPVPLPARPLSAHLTRLDLARWLVGPGNPLAARVTINRMWAAHFGTGIVATVEDFGTKGDPPSHPELLDWLATEFVRRGWDMKAMHRLIVTSATYRQSPRVSPELFARDPQNRLLARGPRVRLEAEMVRDQALAVSGLLSPKIGGPSVMPPMPDGIWNSPYSGDRWSTSNGEDRYRRGLYTFWKRTSPYPSFMSFDAPSREVCTVRRPRTNTPLQALTVLNDPVYIEAAQALAARMAKISNDPAAEATYGFRLTLARRPTSAELDRLLSLYRAEVERFAKDPKAAREMAGSAATASSAASSAELAAWTVVANVLLNLDETLNMS